MLDIKVHDRVSVHNSKIFGSEPVFGTVEDIHEERDIYNILVYRVLLVRLDTGELHKCRAEDIRVIQDPKNEETEDTITISLEDFDRVVSKVIDPEVFKNMFSSDHFALALSMSALIVCDKLKEELFGELGK